jgi:hypothetical protein
LNEAALSPEEKELFAASPFILLRRFSDDMDCSDDKSGVWQAL